MSTKNPRLMVVLEPALQGWLKRSAKKEGISLSMKIRDLVREAYENYEDRYWAKEGERRVKSLKKTEMLSHDDFWKKAGV